MTENPCADLPESELSPLRDPNADLIGYEFEVEVPDGPAGRATATVTGSSRDPHYVHVKITAHDDGRLWASSRVAAQVRRAKELS